MPYSEYQSSAVNQAPEPFIFKAMHKFPPKQKRFGKGPNFHFHPILWNHSSGYVNRDNYFDEK